VLQQHQQRPGAWSRSSRSALRAPLPASSGKRSDFRCAGSRCPALTISGASTCYGTPSVAFDTSPSTTATGTT
jgi:hypothetical protein